MDNLSAHWTPAIRRWAVDNNVGLLPTPTNASYLNRIECHFWAYAEFVIKGSDYATWPEFDKASPAYIHRRNRDHHDPRIIELLRITAPGGILYLTIHDQATVAFCRQNDPESLSRALTGFAQPPESEARFRSWGDRLGVDLDGFTLGRGYVAQVFYDRDAIRRHWGRYAEVVDVVPEAFALHQTAVVLRRRPDDSD